MLWGEDYYHLGIIFCQQHPENCLKMQLTFFLFLWLKIPNSDICLIFFLTRKKILLSKFTLSKPKNDRELQIKEQKREALQSAEGNVPDGRRSKRKRGSEQALEVRAVFPSVVMVQLYHYLRKCQLSSVTGTALLCGLEPMFSCYYFYI